MKPKYKALIFNFIGFAFIFLTVRFTLGYFLVFSHLLMALVAAIAATILAPKFMAVQNPKARKVFMKWIFIRGIREV